MRGGGHNVAGKAVTDGGLMIDLSLMKGIHVDPARRTVRAQAGRDGREFDRATARLRARDPERRRLEHRDRGSHARRRARLADGQVRDGGRQPALRRGGARVGRGRHRERGHRPGPLLGAPRRRRQLRRRDLVRVPRAPARQRPRRAGAASARGGAASSSRSTASSPPTCRTSSPCRPSSRTRPTDRARSFAGSRSAMRATTPTGPRPTCPLREFGSPVADMVQRMPYPVDEHGGRLAVPRGRVQLLEVGVLLGALRRGRRGHDRGRSSRRPASSARWRRGLPRRGHARAADGYGLPAPGAGLQPAPDLAMDRPGARRTQASRGRATPSTRWPRTWPTARTRTTCRPTTTTASAQAYGPNYERLVELKRRYDPDNLFRLNHNIDPTA